MRLRLFALLLPVAAVLLALNVRGPAAENDYSSADEQTVRAASLTPDGPALLEFFRKRSQETVEPGKLTGLVKQLGDKAGDVREKAVGELIAYGPIAVPVLRQAVKDTDEPAVAEQAQRCLKYLEGTSASSLPVAAARLVAVRKPEGAAEVLLNYMPFADDETVSEEVKAALAAVAVRDGKPDPVLVEALKDAKSTRRGAAAEALSRLPGDELRASLRKMLQDPSAAVRMRVALSLARTGKDQKAVSTLIASLADVPIVQAKQAEDYLVELAGDQAPKVSLGTDDASRQKARDAWAVWWLGTEGPALVEEFTKRTLTDEMRDSALKFIKQCGDDNFDVREKASAELAKLGAPIAGLLRQYANDPDLEVSQRVKKCLAGIEGGKSEPLSQVFPRLIALRKPTGAAEAVLNFLPFAEGEGMLTECRDALTAIAVTGGKADPALVAGLSDKHPLKRGVAAEALWLSGLPEHRDAIKVLMKDRDPVCRLRVAMTLAGDQEKDAVPVLINLMAEVPFEQAVQAEEFLRRVAGDKAPDIVLTSEDDSGKKCKEAWSKWWAANANLVNLAVAAGPQRLLGYTMILYTNPPRIIEVGLDGKERWKLDGFQYAYDATVLPGDRVLLAEYNNLRVTERNLKNEVLWTYQMQFNPISAQRLANGNTFIASNVQLVEVDKTGKQVFAIQRPNGDVYGAQKTRDGQIVLFNTSGQVVRLDTTGKELKSFNAGPGNLSCLEVLPNGRILIAHYQQNQVVEYDADGKRVWQAQVTQPTSAVRLPNGNTLVASNFGNPSVTELDRAGKSVWSQQGAGRGTWKARRR